MPQSEPPITYLGARSARARDVWRAPAYRPDVVLLEPLSLLYRGFMRARRHAYERGFMAAVEVGVPVISVGNLVVGGSGKTPFARWLVLRLIEQGRRPAVLHGGYGSDEPELHRRWFTAAAVIESRDRVAGARMAVAQGANVLVLDDALQHLRIARDLDVILISADTWDEPHRLLPSGPWREPLAAINEHAVVIITRKAVAQAEAEHVIAAVRSRTRARIVASCALELQVSAAGPAIAVCAIANPRAFGRQLIQAGALVQEVLAFDDHHEYTSDDWKHIAQIAGGRQVIVTEKDAVKLEKVTETPLIVATQTLRMESGGADVDQAIQRVCQ